VTTCRFSYQTMAVPVGADPAHGFAVLEVPADEVDLTPTGDLTLWRTAPDGRRQALVGFRAGHWSSYVTQSAIDGYPNGYGELRAQPGKLSETSAAWRLRAHRDSRVR